MSKIILCTEIYHSDRTIQSIGVDSVGTIEKAISEMSSGFGMKMKTGTIMTAREESESGKLILVGSVISVRPFSASLFGHDFVVVNGNVYDRNNFSSCPRKLGVPARDRGDRTWISYLSPTLDESPAKIAEDYIHSAYLDSDYFAYWEDRSNILLQKALTVPARIAFEVILEMSTKHISQERYAPERDDLVTRLSVVSEDIYKLESGKISLREFYAMHNLEKMSKIEKMCHNARYIFNPDYPFMEDLDRLGKMIRSCCLGCNSDSYHFLNAINMAAQIAGNARVARMIRESVGLVDMVHEVVAGKYFAR